MFSRILELIYPRWRWERRLKVDQKSFLLSETCGICGVADDQHLRRVRLARCTLPACLHLLHCSKKHFPFSVLSLTQKTHTLTGTHCSTKLTASSSFRGDFSGSANSSGRVRESLGFKTLNFLMHAIHLLA